MCKLLVYRDSRVIEVFLNKKDKVRLSLAISSLIGSSEGEKSFFSYTINIPVGANLPQLSFILDTKGDDAEPIKAVIELGCFQFEGTVLFSGCKENSFPAHFLAGISNIYSKLPEFARELDLGTSMFDIATIEDTWTNIGPYDPEGFYDVWYSLKYYNGFIEPDTVSTLDFRPDVYFKVIVDSIQKHTGCLLCSELFQTDWFGRLLFPYIGTGGMDYRIFESEVTTQINQAGGNFVFDVQDSNTTVTFDPLNMFGLGLSNVRIPNIDGDVIVVLKLELDISTSESGVSVILSDDNLNFKHVETLVDGVNILELTGTYTKLQNIQLFIDSQCTINVGSKFKYEFHDTMPFEGVEVYHNSVFPYGFKTSDLIKGMNELFNLIWYSEGNKAIVDPKFDVELTTGETVTGFYRDSAIIDDYRDVQDCTKDVSTIIDSSLKKTVNWIFKKDDNDILTADNQWAHVEELNNRYPVGTYDKENTAFAATINSQLAGEYIPKATGTNFEYALIPFFTSDSDEIDFDFCPRVLEKMDMYKIKWTLNDVDITGMPLAAQVAFNKPSLALNGYRPVNIGYSDQGDVKGLTNTFYYKDIDIYNHSIKRTLNILIDPNIGNNLLEFFRRLKFAGDCQTGEMYHILESIDITEDDVASIKLISVP